MKITAIQTIIEWDADRGCSCIINPGESGEASDALAKRLIDEGVATELEITANILDENGEPINVPETNSLEPAPLKITDAERATLPQLDHDGNGEPGGSEPHEPPALSGKNKADLTAIAKAEGVTLDDGMTNAQIVAAIEEARAAASDDNAPPA